MPLQRLVIIFILNFFIFLLLELVLIKSNLMLSVSKKSNIVDDVYTWYDVIKTWVNHLICMYNLKTKFKLDVALKHYYLLGKIYIFLVLVREGNLLRIFQSK